MKEIFEFIPSLVFVLATVSALISVSISVLKEVKHEKK